MTRSVYLCLQTTMTFKSDASLLKPLTVAMMSRPVAGTRQKTVILTLPGSPKGARENLESILKLLPHACLQAAGQDSRTLHAGGTKRLEQDAGLPSSTTNRDVDSAAAGSHQHSHDHHHHHDHGHGHGHQIPQPHTRPEDRPQPQSNDPSAGPTARHRASPFPMLSVAQAITRILDATPAPRVVSHPTDTTLTGHVLAEPVTAAEPVPAFRASIVDGYAVAVARPSDTSRKGSFPVVAVSHATPAAENGQPTLQPDQVARITTGAPLPAGADAVVMVEDTAIRQKTVDGREEDAVEILTDAVRRGENVREVGSDVRQGDVVLDAGETVGPGELGLLASVGRADVRVYERPVVGVLSTGDEIVEHGRAKALRYGEVRDTNRPTVLATVRSWGYEAVDLGIAKDTYAPLPPSSACASVESNMTSPDRPDALEAALRAGLRRAHVLITTGGVSMGELDLLKPTLERALGGAILFGRVGMKPGKPTTVARVPFKTAAGARAERLVFALPGNPASAMVTAGLFVLPSLQKAGGRRRREASAIGREMAALGREMAAALGVGEEWRGWGYPRAVATLAGNATCDKVREEYQRAVAALTPGGSLLVSVVEGGQRSSRVGSFRGANALVVLPAGRGMLAAGTKVEVLLMGEVSMG